MKRWRQTLTAKDRLSPYARGGYRITLRDRPAVVRETKTSAGMQFTCSGRRKQQAPNAHALMLIVRGTLDPLARGLQYKVVPGCCPTCGHKTAKLVLTDRGRLRLRVMRRRAQDRKEKADD